jgi:hypothetical protein
VSLLSEVGGPLTEIMVWIQLPGSENDPTKVGLTHDHHQVDLVSANRFAPALNPRVSLGLFAIVERSRIQIFIVHPRLTPVAKNL